ncbi:MAG: hypothetical protein JRD43_05350 [Deltaproteobacteria bacterium]|nr:hypothetical protein [Deltaproteobacteria bacterium]
MLDIALIPALTDGDFPLGLNMSNVMPDPVSSTGRPDPASRPILDSRFRDCITIPFFVISSKARNLNA